MAEPILSEDEKKEIRRRCLEADAIYEYTEEAKLGLKWKGDTERFMAFAALFTKDLANHSITLSRLTKWLIGLTLALLFVGIMNFIALISV